MQQVVDRQLHVVRVHAQADRQRALRVEVDQQHLAAVLRERGAQVDRRRGLADAALLVAHRDDPGVAVDADRAGLGQVGQRAAGRAELHLGLGRRGSGVAVDARRRGPGGVGIGRGRMRRSRRRRVGRWQSRGGRALGGLPEVPDDIRAGSTRGGISERRCRVLARDASPRAGTRTGVVGTHAGDSMRSRRQSSPGRATRVAASVTPVDASGAPSTQAAPCATTRGDNRGVSRGRAGGRWRRPRAGCPR